MVGNYLHNTRRSRIVWDYYIIQEGPELVGNYLIQEGPGLAVECQTFCVCSICGGAGGSDLEVSCNAVVVVVVVVVVVGVGVAIIVTVHLYFEQGRPRPSFSTC